MNSFLTPGLGRCLFGRHPRQMHPKRPYSASRSMKATPSSQTATGPSVFASVRSVVEHGPVGKLFGAYSRVQAKRPYTTQVCSSVVVWLCGDLSAQLLFPSDGKREGQDQPSGSKETSPVSHRYDPWRTARHLTVGIVASIPSYEWFMWLHRHFNFPSKVASLLTKVVVQQAVYTPVFNTYFFTMQSLLAGASLQETLVRLQLALPTSIVNSVKVWSGVAFVSFLWVPPQFRSVFSGCVAVGWQTYLSWMNAMVSGTIHKSNSA